jgi:hypothetical protein
MTAQDAGDEGHRQARLPVDRLQRSTFDQADLLGGRPAAPALDRRDHLNAAEGG